MAWFNAGLSSNSGGASSFDELDDVAINTQTLSNGQVPVYNSTTHKWENGEQSGGSSGHTIIDDGGTSLTQRDNLQFKGAYSEDNSANGKTVVNVVRSMTKAQFDQLTNNEKTGFINITDITGGNDDRFQPVIYSTDEREIGVWIDGKPLYEKTFIYDNVSYSGNVNIDNQFSGIDNAFISDGFSVNAYGAILPIAYAQPDVVITGNLANAVNAYCVFINSAKTGFGIRLGTNQTLTYLQITLRYTKTTDQAGSGQWTPQGVPAHHYSTDEQVVGTWIDGSTLYEKTIIFLNQVIQGGDNFLSLGVTNMDIVVESNALITNSSHTNIRPINTWHLDAATSQMWYRITPSSGELWIHAESTWPTPNIYVTLRYTKSST